MFKVRSPLAPSQVLSPLDLKGVASGDPRECALTVERWWRVFHAIRKALVEFELVFTNRLDIGVYSVMNVVEKCKVGKRKESSS